MIATYSLNYRVGSYEEWFALELLLVRQMQRRMALLMGGVQAATGNGRIPLSWLKSIIDDPDLAYRLSVEINSERLARRVWGKRTSR